VLEHVSSAAARRIPPALRGGFFRHSHKKRAGTANTTPSSVLPQSARSVAAITVQKRRQKCGSTLVTQPASGEECPPTDLGCRHLTSLPAIGTHQLAASAEYECLVF
jgi:hypothetical protein